MYLSKLEIKGFGKLNGWSADLAQGISVIFGKNESGKSTVQAFIMAMFYGLKGGRAGKDGELPPLKKYKPWRGLDYNGFLEYVLDSGDIFRIGRDFEDNTIRVFDSNFNNITDIFNIGKDKKILLAEKHLGINEDCFERTVFVRQMDTRVQDGSKELLNRLSNVYQTGFEDVSFKRAEEALKSALKRYVGTDRTTTRPLDRINLRLEELNAARSSLNEKREQFFILEEKLKQKKAEEAKLRDEKQVLEILKNVAELEVEAVECNKKKLELEQIILKVLDLVEQQENLKKHISKIVNDMESLSAFSVSEVDDLEALNQDYSSMIALESYKVRLQGEVFEKGDELKKAHISLEQVNVFKTMPRDIESQVSNLNREIEELKLQCNKKPLEELEVKLVKCCSWVKKIKVFALIFAVLAAAFLIVGFTGRTFGFVLFVLSAAVFAGSVYLFIKESRTNIELIKSKKIIESNMGNYLSLLKEKTAKLAKVYEDAGVFGYEEFLMLKASISSRTDAVISLNGQLGRFENEVYSIDRQILTVRNSILERLYSAGLTNEASSIEDKIKEYKDSANRYKKLDGELGLSRQRFEDLKVSMEAHFDAAYRITQKRYVDKADISFVLNGIEEKLADSTKEIQLRLKAASALWNQPCFDEYARKYVGSNFDNSCLEKHKKLNVDYEAINSNLNDILLQIREIQTVIRGLEADDDTLQKIEEETAQLEQERKELEEKGMALKLGLDVLVEASKEIQKDYAPALNMRMSKIIPKITSDRYENLRADSNLKLMAMAPETGDILNVSSFSGGTIDQMYLAMRVALADVISSAEEKLPLILDEVFSQYDDKRTRDTINFLMEEANERQIVVFTCKAREVELFTEICGEDINLINL